MSDPAILDLVERQAHAWERNDFAVAAADWMPDGVLTAPGAIVPFAALEAAMTAFHRDFTGLEVTITNIFHDDARTKVAIEWTWTVSRRADGRRSATPDAIIVDLDGGRIRSWREYFDLSGSVEAPAAKCD
jgi:uncharacterized protein (TIGR02246 family)